MIYCRFLSESTGNLLESTEKNLEISVKASWNKKQTQNTCDIPSHSPLLFDKTTQESIIGQNCLLHDWLKLATLQHQKINALLLH